MSEIGIIASVVQIADVGLRLSIKLYTFGEIVASADRSVISISKDVSLTSGVLKELGQILDKDKETGTFSETAVQTADGVVKECLEVFKEMDNIIVKRLPSLGAAGKGGGQGERVRRATVMLERLKWGYLQPKLELLRSNLDSLKSTLLLMLNVITYARQVSEKAELPSVIAEQKCLIEDLAQSNQEYILKFERLKLGIEEPPGRPVDDASRGGVVGTEPSNITTSLSGTLTRNFKRMKSVIAGTSLQDKGNPRGFGSKELNTATWSTPNAGTNNRFINTSLHSSPAMTPVQERGIPTTEAPMAFDQELLFKQLEHHSMLIKNLLKEVDEVQYKITFPSRLRMKGGIAGLHEGERRDLEKMWGLTALQRAEQRLDPLIGELPRVCSFAAPVASAKTSPYMAHMLGTPRPFRKAPVAEAPQYDPTYEDEYRSASHLPTSIDPLSTYAGDRTHRSDLLSHIVSCPPVHQDRLVSTPENAPMRSWKSLPAHTLAYPQPQMAASRSRLESMRRADIAKATAEKQSKSSTITKQKDTGDRIGGYIEPHQEEDDTGEGGVDMTTPPNTYLSSSAGKQNEKPGTDSAAPLQSIPQQPLDDGELHLVQEFNFDDNSQVLELARPDSPEGSDISYGMAPRSYANNARSHPHSLQANGAKFLKVPAEYLRGDSGALLAPAPQAPAKLQSQTEQGDSQLGNVDLVNRLVSLWTTVKP